MSGGTTIEAAERALRALDEAAQLTGSSRTAVAKALGIGGSTIMKISRGEAVVEAVAQRCEDNLAGVRRLVAKGGGASEEAEEDGGEEAEPARRAPPRKARARAKDARAPARRVPKRVPETARRGSAPKPKPAPESELTRAARVIASLGGIDRAERIAEALS